MQFFPDLPKILTWILSVGSSTDVRKIFLEILSSLDELLSVPKMMKTLWTNLLPKLHEAASSNAIPYTL